MFDFDSEGIVRRIRVAFPEVGDGLPATFRRSTDGSA